MKVIIAGSRDITDLDTVIAAVMASGWHNDISEVVSGTARGVDRLGEMWATMRPVPVPVIEFPADWETNGKTAGLDRNYQMAEYADALVAVWDGESSGTAHMIRTMKRLEKPVYVHLVPK